MLTVYGIPNCDTIKKTRTWLDKNKVHTNFTITERTAGEERIDKWFKTLPWDKVVNKASTTWKELSTKKKPLLPTKNQLRN
jgi:arsenate reductase